MHTTEGAVATDDSRPDDLPDERFDDPAPVEVVVVGVVALVVGTVLRFTTQSSLWLDEALSVNIAQLPLGDITDWLRHDGHPPLYYLLLHGWIEVFGSGDVAVRALAGVFGLATLPLAWVAGRRRGGPLLGWVTVSVVALSPFAVRYSDEARMYSMVMFLAFAGYLLVDDVMRRGRDGWLRLSAVALVAAALLYTHYWAIWLLAATGLLVLWQAWRADAAVRARALKVAGALVVGGVLFLPWLPSMLYQSAHTGTPWAPPARPSVALAFTLFDLGSGLYDDAAFFGILLALLVVLGVFGRARGRHAIDLDLRTQRQLRPETLVLALTFLIGIAMAFVARGAYATRYASVFFPFLVLLIAAGVTRFAARWLRFGVLVALCAILAIGAFWNIGDTRTQAGEIAATIDDHAQPGDLVVYCPDQLGPGTSRIVTADVEQVSYPNLTDPGLVDWVDYGERNEAVDPIAVASEIVARAPAERGIFVVWNGEYRTVERDCQELVSAIAAQRPAQELVQQKGRYFEHAYLMWFPPTA
jgi:uncharacterized membrane protein